MAKIQSLYQEAIKFAVQPLCPEQKSAFIGIHMAKIFRKCCLDQESD